MKVEVIDLCDSDANQPQGQFLANHKQRPAKHLGPNTSVSTDDIQSSMPSSSSSDDGSDDMDGHQSRHAVASKQRTERILELKTHSQWQQQNQHQQLSPSHPQPELYNGLPRTENVQSPPQEFQRSHKMASDSNSGADSKSLAKESDNEVSINDDDDISVNDDDDNMKITGTDLQEDHSSIASLIVPLRDRAQSFSGSSTSRQGASSIPAGNQLREQLCDATSLYSFTRMLCRCTPTLTDLNSSSQNRRSGHIHRNGRCRLDAHWTPRDMCPLPYSFANAQEYSRAYFLPLVEECRAGLETDAVDGEREAESDKDRRRDKDKGLNAHTRTDVGTWLSATVISVMQAAGASFEPVGATNGESSAIVNGTAKGPDLGSLLMVRLHLEALEGSTPTSASAPPSTNATPATSPLDSLIGGGDVLLLDLPTISNTAVTSSASTLSLGIVPGWDLDYENKYSSGLHKEWLDASGRSGFSNSGTCAGSITMATAARDAWGRSVVSVLVCAQGSAAGDAQGGWLDASLLRPHTHLRVCVVGCAITALREVAALRHVPRSLGEPMRGLLLNGSRGLPPAPAAAAPAPAVPPPSVPAALWAKLLQEHDASQLEAIRAICASDLAAPLLSVSATSSSVCPPPPITLLCGPPGTGKTKSILGMISALLAGGAAIPSTGATAGGAHESRGKVGVVAGMSLKLAKPRSPLRTKSTGSSKAIGDAAVKGCIPATRILICAPSNTAVDELLLRILRLGVYRADGQKYTSQELKVLRVGVPGKPGGHATRKAVESVGWTRDDIELLESVSLDVLVDRERQLFEANATTASQTTSASARKPGTRLYGAHGAWATASKSHERLPTRSELALHYLQQAHIVCSTLSGAASQPMLEFAMLYQGKVGVAGAVGSVPFSAVIIDEAAQASEPACLVPLRYNPPQLVLVGDPAQLQPTLLSPAAKAVSYGRSLFERLAPSGAHNTAGSTAIPYYRLRIQYRMLPELIRYPSLRWYDNVVCTAPAIERSGSHVRPYHSHESGLFRPLMLHDLTYGRERREGVSISNAAEAKYVVRLYSFLSACYPASFGLSGSSDLGQPKSAKIGIIAPYRAQRALIQRFAREMLGASAAKMIELGTIDGFQGREKEIIILSCVRAPPEGSMYGSRDGRHGTNIGFLSEPQRMNVAFTRAQCALWVVGHADTLEYPSSSGHNVGEWGRWVRWMRSQRHVLRVTHEEPFEHNPRSKVAGDNSSSGPYRPRPPILPVDAQIASDTAPSHCHKRQRSGSINSSGSSNSA